MKSYLAILSIIVISLNICQAQDTVRRNVPLLKESIKIDSLILCVIDINKSIKVSENDSCMLLGLFKNNNDAGFIRGIHALNHEHVIFDFEKFRNNHGLGYFEFNGYLIFVYGNEFMSQFFTDTKSKKEFTFVKSKVQDEISVMRNFTNWVVFYKNGEFGCGVH